MKRKVGSRLCLGSLVIQQIQEKCDPLPSSSDPVRPRLSQQSDSDVRGASLAARVSTKLDAGKFRGAVRLACSEDSIAEENDETIPTNPSTQSPTLILPCPPLPQ